MKAMPQLKAVLTALALGLALLPAAQAQAQAKDVQTLQKGRDVKFPAGLKWEMMRYGDFSHGGMFNITASTAEKSAATKLWKKELDSMPPNKFFDRSKGEYPAEFLISTYDNDKYRFVFSIMYTLHMDYPACSDPLNGPFPQGFDFNNAQMYNVCPMRVVRQDKTNNQVKDWTLNDFCVVHEDYSEEHEERKDHPLADNHTEVAIHGDTAYFRVIQYGKWVPACNRSIRLQ